MSLLRGTIAILLITATAVTAAAEGKLTLEQVIAKHLSSIGTQEVRATAQSRVAKGTSRFSKWQFAASGKATLISRGDRVRLTMEYDDHALDTDWDCSGSIRDDLITDGVRVRVSGVPCPSPLPAFLDRESALVSDGLFQGTLSTAWPFLDKNVRFAKLTYGGLKLINGKSLHEVRYKPKKRSDLDIRLYFDRDFNHVLTVASLVASTPLRSRSPTGYRFGPVCVPDARYRIEQWYSNFEHFDGLTLPTLVNTLFETEECGSESSQRYTNTFDRIVNNVSLDESAFRTK